MDPAAPGKLGTRVSTARSALSIWPYWLRAEPPSGCSDWIRRTPVTENPPIPDSPSTPVVPPPPPQHWFADVLASDGGVVRLRPITPDDADRLQEFHAALSDRTRYL